MSHLSDKGVANALSFDVEDWYHGLCASPQEWCNYPDRLAIGMDRVLGLLDESSVKATFFVLAPLARFHPALIRTIAALGHEVASHGYSHIPIYCQTRDRFRQDVDTSIGLLEDTVGQPISGYRAPFFSVTPRTPWALDVIKQAGFSYDSSIFPVHNPRYGDPAARRFPHELPNGLWEFPLSTLQAGPLRIPFSGGVYARLLGTRLVRWAIRSLNRQNRPALVYFHPWEFDPLHPRRHFKGLSGLYHFTHYHRLNTTGPLLNRLFNVFQFGPIRSLLPMPIQDIRPVMDKLGHLRGAALKPPAVLHAEERLQM
jgi:polysaccharide deacetylase family protein (PEP-CTERM system associated)